MKQKYSNTFHISTLSRLCSHKNISIVFSFKASLMRSCEKNSLENFEFIALLYGFLPNILFLRMNFDYFACNWLNHRTLTPICLLDKRFHVEMKNMHLKDYYAIPDPPKAWFIFNFGGEKKGKHIWISKLNKQPHGGFESVNLQCWGNERQQRKKKLFPRHVRYVISRPNRLWYDTTKAAASRRRIIFMKSYSNHVALEAS